MIRDPWASHTDPDAWTRIRSKGRHITDRRPEPGEIIGLRYAAWRVIEVRPFDDVDLTDEVRQQMARLKPEFRERCRPYALVLDHVAGPNLLGRRRAHLDGTRVAWVLLGERYAVCSCHGHPWPCQDADRDRVAEMQAAAMDRTLAKAVPGVCQGCGEPITRRQKTVTYVGESLLVPGGPTPKFHTRSGCWSAATDYELKWLAADPRRERILTWPKCSGVSIVHADGSDECHRAGDRYDPPSPDCRGHRTHDHMAYSSCVSAYAGEGGCPRGCRRQDHRGIGSLTKRPERRDAQALL